jgi:hypothetical protein
MVAQKFEPPLACSAPIQFRARLETGPRLHGDRVPGFSL